MSSPSLLLPSLVDWKIMGLVILYFGNECEQRLPGWPFFESEMELQPSLGLGVVVFSGLSFEGALSWGIA